MADLTGTRALVTGGTSGLGLAMARALAQAGATVLLTGRDAGRAEEAAARLPGAGGLGLDVRDETSVASAVDRAWSRLGGLDLLVNNAGIGMRTVNPRFMIEPLGFWQVPADGFRAVIDTNLTGYFLVAREVVPRMLNAGGGRIVNISMNHETMTRKGFVPYGPSRAGAEALSRIMAADLRGTPVTVNMLLPGGATATGMLPAADRPPGLRPLDPAVMGPPIVWLASSAADGVHDERVVATEFDEWLAHRTGRGRRPDQPPAARSGSLSGLSRVTLGSAGGAATLVIGKLNVQRRSRLGCRAAAGKEAGRQWQRNREGQR
jgi:NAD(P)-dependent dehydrogenase (short-subunit alcohol dehydrogenase family)